MELTEKIRDLAQATLTDENLFIVDVIYSLKQGPSKKMMVIVDGDKGVTIDDCVYISRELSKILDETNLVDDHYLLEVSTPGLDHPLKLKRQYKKNVGRSLKVHFKDKISKEQRVLIAEWLANVVNDQWKKDDFQAYKPNEDKDDFWTVDRNNNIKVQFFNDELNDLKIIHRYNSPDAIIGLSRWLAYCWYGEVVE